MATAELTLGQTLTIRSDAIEDPEQLAAFERQVTHSGEAADELPWRGVVGGGGPLA